MKTENTHFSQVKNTYYTHERLQSDIDFYRAQKLAKQLLANGLISLYEFNKLSDINFKIFSPLFSEIYPKKT